MLSMKILMRFVDRGFVFKTLYLILLVSAVPIGEIALLLYLESFVGTYLLLALVAATGLIGILVAFRQIRSILAAIRKRTDSGEYPEEEFVDLAGALLGSVLLVTPGFVSDVFGLLLILPFLRRLAGRLVTVRMRDRLKEVYEYLKLYDL